MIIKTAKIIPIICNADATTLCFPDPVILRMKKTLHEMIPIQL